MEITRRKFITNGVSAILVLGASPTLVNASTWMLTDGSPTPPDFFPDPPDGALRASFASVSSEVKEGEAVNIRVNFSAPFSGELHFRLLRDQFDPLAIANGETRNSAQVGSDFNIPGLEVLSGDGAENNIAFAQGKIEISSPVSNIDIPIQLLVDGVYNPEKRIIVQLAPGPGYRVADNREHFIVVEEVDPPLDGTVALGLSFDKGQVSGEEKQLSAAFAFPIIARINRVNGGTTIQGEVVLERGFSPTTLILSQIGRRRADGASIAEGPLRTRPTFESTPSIPVGTPVTGTYNPGNRRLTLAVGPFKRPGLARAETPEKIAESIFNPLPIDLHRLIEIEIDLPEIETETWEGSATEKTFENDPSGPILTQLQGTVVGTLARNESDPGILPATKEYLEEKSRILTESLLKSGNLRAPRALQKAIGIPSSGHISITPIATGFLAASTVRNLSALGDRNWALTLGGAFAHTPKTLTDLFDSANISLQAGTSFWGRRQLNEEWQNPETPPPPAQRNLLKGDIAGIENEYIEEHLLDAERKYVSLISAAPFGVNLEDAQVNNRRPLAGQKGVLETRIRYTVFQNAMADRASRAAFNLRLESSDSDDDILSREVEEFQKGSDHARNAVDALMELFADRQRLGVGAILRHEAPELEDYLGAVEQEIRTIKEVTCQAARRWTEYQFNSIRLEIMESLAPGSGASSDRSALIAAAQGISIYLEEVIRLLGTYGDPSDTLNEGIGILVGLAEEAKGLAEQINRGYNPFGFPPDFVPFIGDSQSENPSANVTGAVSFAGNFLTASNLQIEAEAYQNWERFQARADEYQNRVAQLMENYGQRLRAMVGTIENVGDGIQPIERYEPDLYSYLLEEVEEGSQPEDFVETEPPSFWRRRDAIAALSTPNTTRILRSRGEVAVRVQNIRQAGLRVEASINEMISIDERIDVIIDSARRVDEINTNSAELQAKLILRNGREMEARIKQKGELQARLIEASRAAQRKAEKRKRRWGVVSSVIGTASSALAASKTIDVREKTEKFWPVVGAVALGGAQAYVNNRASKAASRANDAIAALEAEAARAQAKIDAEMENIRTVERADLILINAENQRAVNQVMVEERVKLLLIDQAKLGLAIAIAEHDVIKEEILLQNFYAEVETLAADFMRHLLMVDDQSNPAWNRPDYREIATARQRDAEVAFRRAQMATWLAVRALDYYAANGIQLGDLYARTFRARRFGQLSAILDEFPAQVSAFDAEGVSRECEEAHFSLKYHLATLARTQLDQEEGLNSASTTGFSYYDNLLEELLEGQDAYNAFWRDFIHANLKEIPIDPNNPAFGTRPVLKVQFSTDVNLRREFDNLPPGSPSSLLTPSNPFATSISQRGIVIGGRNTGCGLNAAEGISILFRGTVETNSPVQVSLSQSGNIYQRSMNVASGVTGPEQFPAHPNYDPMDQLIAYPTYQQDFSSLFRVGSSTSLEVGETDDGGPAPTPVISQNRLGSERKAEFAPHLRTYSGTPRRTFAFTFRGVACDRWVLEINALTQPNNLGFLRVLREKLDEALSDPNVTFDYLEDIQLRFAIRSRTIQ